MKFGYNSKQYDPQAAVISPYDHGFLYGMGVFETWRTYQGESFLLDRHLARLQSSLATIGIQWVADETRVEKEVKALLHANGLQDAYVRLSISAGVEPLGLPTATYTQPNELTLVKAVAPATFVDTASRPIQLLHTTRLAPETDIRIKSFHYMNAILGKQEMWQYPWAIQAEGIMLDPLGDVAEGLTSNLFLVQAGRIITPPLETGILPGVTRQFVIDLANKLGLPVEQQRFKWDAVLQADEVFLTNSVQAIVPVHQAFDPTGESHAFQKKSPVTNQLQAAYEQAVQQGAQ
jgi:4-amino-4-deoxychorismate lyase